MARFAKIGSSWVNTEQIVEIFSSGEEEVTIVFSAGGSRRYSNITLGEMFMKLGFGTTYG